MAGKRAAIRYAKAVLSLALDQNAIEVINGDMQLMANTIAQSTDLRDMLNSPVVNAAIKKTALVAVFKDLNALIIKTIDLLITNKRIVLLEQVALEYSKLYDEHRGIEVATVTTALPLTDDLKVKVLAKVKELTGKDVEVENIIDEDILGGFILRVGDTQYNASIANQLNKLKREFTLN